MATQQLTLTFEESIDQRFARFDADNPQVYQWLRTEALRLRRKGFQKYSIKTLVEVLRWTADCRTDTTEEWKINNDFTSRYARKLMCQEPELAGFFELRRLIG